HRHAGDEQRLQQHQQRREEDRRADRELSERGEDADRRKQDRHRQREVHEVREHDHDRQRLGRKHHLLDEARVRRDRVRRLQYRRREKRPRQNSGEKKERKQLYSLRRKELCENERVDREQQQRIGQRPEIAEERAAIAGFQIARGQRRDELAVAEKSREVVHSAVAQLRGRSLSRR